MRKYRAWEFSQTDLDAGLEQVESQGYRVRQLFQCSSAAPAYFIVFGEVLAETEEALRVAELYMAGRDCRDIAKELHISMGTVSKRARRAVELGWIESVKTA